MSAANPFKKATRKTARLRLGLIGPSGSGKTYTSLRVASAMKRLMHTAQPEREPTIAVIDTESHSSELYSDEFGFDTKGLEGSFHPRRYVESIKEAEAFGYDFLIIDSLSHAWIGKDGGLDLHDAAVVRQKTKNTYTAWSEVTPHHNQLVQALVQCRCHLIVTLRSKVDYVQEKDERGKTIVRKVGTAPLMREGLEYEFHVVGDMDDSNSLIISKSRCRPLARQVIPQPGEEFARILMAWLTEGVADEPRIVAPQNGNSVVIGMDLLRRLTTKDHELASKGLCLQGDLVAAVKAGGAEKGLGPNIEEWPEEGFHLAKAVAKKFELEQKKRKDEMGLEPGEG